jgi:hypothetical protein
MNEAETRAELIDPALKAAGWGVVEASRVRREAITLIHQQGASGPSAHVHRRAIIGYPTRNIPRLIEDVGDHRRRPGVPGEPIAMQLDPGAERAVYARLRKPGVNFRVCSWSCSRIKRWSSELLTSEV